MHKKHSRTFFDTMRKASQLFFAGMWKFVLSIGVTGVSLRGVPSGAQS
jgi:hypothetical protein